MPKKPPEDATPRVSTSAPTPESACEILQLIDLVLDVLYRAEQLDWGTIKKGMNQILDSYQSETP